MKILRDYNLFKLNTFGIEAKTDFFVEIKKEDDLRDLFSLPEFKKSNKFFLGGGSNVLFTKDFNGFIVKNKLKGIEVLKENQDHVFVRAMGGESWHDFVVFSVKNGYWGVENLSLIPGMVGSAPVQNIGAYGVELKDCLVNVEVFEVSTGAKKILNKEECKFGYRESIFKNLKGKYFISAVTFQLDKKEKKNIDYKTIKEYLEKNKIKIFTSKDISDVIISIRKERLPDPKVIGNAGSFFKNVYVEEEKLQELLKKYPNIPSFKENGFTKIPTGWLIEECGPANGISWKGYKVGNVGVYEKQALVLVNHGGATGKEVLDLARDIILSVKDKFGLELTPEVNIV